MWRAMCPHCGAPVEFRSAAAPLAVCSFCQSTLARDGDALKRIGQVAEVFDDHTALQLGSSGRYKEQQFTLIGRVQWRSSEGIWNEWYVLFDDGRAGWLSEDNGLYVIGLDQESDKNLPATNSLDLGQRLSLNEQVWTVSAITQAEVLAAQGELPRINPTVKNWSVVELRNNRNQVASWAHSFDQSSPNSKSFFVGHGVLMSDLSFRGLKESFVKELKSNGLSCPNCGASIAITLKTTQSVTCGQCHSVVDISKGIGEQLSYVAQTNPEDTPGAPLIALGTTGLLALNFGEALLSWQVVGYMERATTDDEEIYFWREYLLWNQVEGFAFLVDSSEGWSFVRPLTGAPSNEQGGAVQVWNDLRYRRVEQYKSRVTWVVGEFYWPVRLGDTTLHIDFKNSSGQAVRQLNRERTAHEVVWSEGRNLTAQEVRKAFSIADDKTAIFERDFVDPDVSPVGMSWGKVILWVLVIFVVLYLLSQCDGSGSGGGGSGGYVGGSYGGYSSGGFHK